MLGPRALDRFMLSLFIYYASIYASSCNHLTYKCYATYVKLAKCTQLN